MIPNINPQITPNVFVRLVKIPTANTPANGTPNNPVTNKNKSHKSFELEAIKYSDIPRTENTCNDDNETCKVNFVSLATFSEEALLNVD